MTKDPLHTRLCDQLGIEYPIVAFTHCKDVAVAVINSGGFAVLGEAMHTPEDIEADTKWIRDRVDGKPFGIDLVLPASAPAEASLDEIKAKIPQSHIDFEQSIMKKYDVPKPKQAVDLHQWGGLNQALGRAQLEVLLEERVPVIASGLGSPAFLLDAAHARDCKVWGLVGRTHQARRQIESGSISGFTMRVLKCPWTEEWKKPEAPRPLASPYQMILSSDYIQGANDHRRADLMTEASGQGVGFVTEMKPARQIVFDMVEEALTTFDDIVGLPD